MKVVRWLKTKKGINSFKKNAVIGCNIKFGDSARCTNFTHEKEKIYIGDHSYIMGSICACCGAQIRIGDHAYIGQNTFIGAAQSITIGRCVIISNDVKIYDNNNHPTSPKARENMSLNGFSNNNWSWEWADKNPVVIEDNVWIGQYATILKGVTIGEGSIVATRAVVTKDVPPYTIVAGNPAKVVKYIENDK